MDSKKKSHQFTFSKKEGMSVEKAKQNYKAAAAKPMGTAKRRAIGNTFVQKLYKDDEELNELKVLAGDGNFDSDVEDKDEGGEARKRENKSQRKKEGLLSKAGGSLTMTKIGKLVSRSLDIAQSMAIPLLTL